MILGTQSNYANVSFSSNLNVGNNLIVNQLTTLCNETVILGTQSNYDNVSFLSNLNVGNNFSVTGVTLLCNNTVILGTQSNYDNVSFASNLNIGNNLIITGTQCNFSTVNLSSNLNINGLSIYSSNNYLGIGKSNPTSTLDVAGDLNFTGTLRQGGVPYIGSQWSNNSSNVFLLSSNVGINKVNPSYPLDVAGDLNFDGILRQGGVPYIGSQWSNILSNVVLMSSNVGIGKIYPSYPLDVAGDINFGGILRKDGVPYIGSQWSNNSSNVFLISSNVGINKVNPSYLLDIAGDLNFDGILRKGGVPYVGSQWSNNSNNVFLMNSNVGIGTSNPLNILSINSTSNNSNVTISMTNLSNNSLKIGVNDYVNGNSFIQSDCNLILSSKRFISVSNVLTTSNSPSNYLNLLYPNLLTVSNLTPLSNWSGYSQGNPSQQPIYHSSNGYSNIPYVSFLGNSSNTVLSAANQSYNINTNGGFTFISFMRFTSNQAFPRIFTTANPGYIEITQNGTALGFNMNGLANFNINTGNIITIGEWNVYTFRVNASTKTTSIYQNMTSVASGTTPYTSNVTQVVNYIGKSLNGDPYMQADVGYMAIYDSFISDATLSNMLVNIYNPTTTTTSYNNLVVAASNVYTYNNVGIGKSNPDFLLDVAGDLNFTGTLRQGGAPYVGSQWSNNSNNVFLLGSNIGIGLSNPTTPLSVNGSATIGGLVASTGIQIFQDTGVILSSNTSFLPYVTGFSNDNNGVVISIPGGTSNNYIKYVASNVEIARLTGNGYFGINTTNPIANLHVNGTGMFSGQTIMLSNQTNPFLLIQNNIGTSLMGVATSATVFSTDATAGDFIIKSFTGNKIILQSSNLGSALCINSNNCVGIANPMAVYPLDVVGNARFQSLIGTGNRSLYADPSGILTINPSDSNLKQNVSPIPYGLSEILKLNPITYYWKDNVKFKFGDQKEVGLLAQEVSTIIPEIVHSNNNGYLSLDYEKIVPVLIKAIQELNNKIEILQKI